MVKISTIGMLAGVLLSLSVYANAESNKVKVKVKCGNCHANFQKQLGGKHPAVTADSITVCVACHAKLGKKEQLTGENPFSARIHRAHGSEQNGVDCVVCHEMKAGKRFSVKGKAASQVKLSGENIKLYRQSMAYVAEGKFLASAHNSAQISCSGCHSTRLPVKGDCVENERCLSCHGPIEGLAERSKPKEAHGPNPHKSHLGDIACTSCHYGHQKSVLYCKDCHPKLTIKIPYGE